MKAHLASLPAPQDLNVERLEPVDAERLRDSLLGGKTRREMLTRETLGVAVCDLAGVEQLGLELGGSFETVAEPLRLAEIDANHRYTG
jgi:hypothetical protein